MDTVGKRIRQALEIRNMKQIDLARATGMGRGAISQYMSDKVKPKQDKIFLMAKALLVSPAWLLGYDVPMATGKETIDVDESFSTSRLVMDDSTKEHLRVYLSLSADDRAKVDEYMEFLSSKARDAAQCSMSSTAEERIEAS